MSASRIKTVAIVLLLLVNLFLLLLVTPTLLAGRRQEQQMQSRLQALFSEQGIRLEGDLAQDAPALPALRVTYAPEAALQAARALLGDEVLLEEDNARYLSHFVAAGGHFSIDRSGQFTAELSADRSAVSAPSADARKLLTAMGITADNVQQETNGTQVTITATQTLLRTPVYPASITLHYEDGRLRDLSGTLYLGTPTHIDDQTCMHSTDALIAFLTARDTLEWSGSVISGVSLCFSRSGSAAASTIRLDPVWKIETDRGVFLVNGMTGLVTAV